MLISAHKNRTLTPRSNGHWPNRTHRHIPRWTPTKIVGRCRGWLTVWTTWRSRRVKMNCSAETLSIIGGSPTTKWLPYGGIYGRTDTCQTANNIRLITLRGRDAITIAEHMGNQTVNPPNTNDAQNIGQIRTGVRAFGWKPIGARMNPSHHRKRKPSKNWRNGKPSIIWHPGQRPRGGMRYPPRGFFLFPISGNSAKRVLGKVSEILPKISRRV